MNTGMKVLMWGLVNVFLLGAIFFVLDYYGLWSLANYVQSSMVDSEGQVKSEDSFLLEREEIRKQRMSLNGREDILKAREIALSEMTKNYQSTLLGLRVKSDQLNEQEEAFLQRQREEKDRLRNIQDIAEKIRDMPPQNAIERLEGLDSLLVIEIFRELDRQAEDLGDLSIVPFLLAEINIEKAQEIIRFKAEFPREAFGELD